MPSSGLPSSGGPSCERNCGGKKESIVKWPPGAGTPASQAGGEDSMVGLDAEITSFSGRRGDGMGERNEKHSQ